MNVIVDTLNKIKKDGARARAAATLNSLVFENLEYFINLFDDRHRQMVASGDSIHRSRTTYRST